MGGKPEAQYRTYVCYNIYLNVALLIVEMLFKEKKTMLTNQYFMFYCSTYVEAIKGREQQ